MSKDNCNEFLCPLDDYHIREHFYNFKLATILLVAFNIMNVLLMEIFVVNHNNMDIVLLCGAVFMHTLVTYYYGKMHGTPTRVYTRNDIIFYKSLMPLVILTFLITHASLMISSEYLILFIIHILK